MMMMVMAIGMATYGQVKDQADNPTSVMDYSAFSFGMMVPHGNLAIVGNHPGIGVKSGTAIGFSNPRTNLGLSIATQRI